MPYHLFALPVSATGLKVTHRGEDYPLLLDTDTFDRTGEDGDMPILPICGGDEYVGESLEGEWHRGWDTDIGNFTATISGGTLLLTGTALVAGTWGEGWINSFHPAPLVDELEVTVSMEVPIDDTGAVANRNIRHEFMLRQDKDELNPSLDDNRIWISQDVNENGLYMVIYKEVAGTPTTLDSGYDYTMDGTRSTGNLEACIWRLVFDGKPGTDGALLYIYLKQAATLALAEVATENELDGSPYDISDLAFNVAYPSYYIATQNTTYFGIYGSVNRAASTYLRLDYPVQIDVKYNFTEADYGKGQVEVWDGDPASGGVRVYDEDHEFSNDVYVQNGLLRVIVDDGANHGIRLEPYLSANYVNLSNSDMIFKLTPSGSTPLGYPYFISIRYLSPEQVIFVVKTCDTAVNDDNIFDELLITVMRGSYYVFCQILNVYPRNKVNAYCIYWYNSRFAYLGDGILNDADLLQNTKNTTMTDNFSELFDPDRDGVILSGSSNILSDTQKAGYRGQYIEWDSITVVNLEDVILTAGITPFSLIANLFKEAENATLAGGATEVDPDALASNLKSVLLNAQNENVSWTLIAGTNIPAGTYLAVFRAKDINLVNNDLRIKVENSTDAVFRNQENANVFRTMTATYAYYAIFFYVSDADVTGTDNIKIEALKATATANEIYIDDFTIFPIGNGKNYPQDLAHSALRDSTQHPRLCER